VFAVRILFLNWRDTRNPEGGGSERYVESVATRLAREGHVVTVFCAAHRAAPRDETIDGVRYVRRGSKLGVYPQALWQLATRRLGRIDVVVDVQNGVPFFSRLVTRKPVVVLVHHVHREQWRVVYGPVRARIGWWLESRIAPALYRHCQYIAVSGATRDELVGLRVDGHRIAVVHNGSEPALLPTVSRSDQPLLCVLGRLVPHKRVEHAFETVRRLAPEVPGLRLIVVGQGWWEERLRAAAAEAGVEDLVHFAGYLEDGEKHAALATSWVLLTPSLKEGWGLSIVEAASHGVPTVAYHSAGGVAESVHDGETGLLVDDDVDAFIAATRLLLTDAQLRERMGAAARLRAKEFTWDAAAASFLAVLRTAVRGETRHDRDPVAGPGSSPVDLENAGQRLP
jgi:glycosyltransferase involved in cell wall biosynthesis